MEKVSIIIPCYNTEKYLSDCILSVCNQSYSNLEIITINDGSTDSTLKILNDFAIKDERIIVHSQKNKGVSTSRNIGIKSATGKYILFIDSDDFIQRNYIESLVDYLEKNNYNFVTTGFTICNESGKKIKNVQYSNVNKQLSFDEIIPTIINRIYFSSSCKTLIRRDFLIRNSIQFNDKLTIGEDFLFMVNLFENSKVAGFLANSNYFYRINSHSVTQKMDLDKVEKYLDDNIFIFEYISRYTNKNYLISNALLVKLNNSLKKLSNYNDDFLSFKDEYFFIKKKYNFLFSDGNIDLSEMDPVNIFDRILIYLIMHDKVRQYFYFCKGYKKLKKIVGR